jgi:hypothetical protein
MAKPTIFKAKTPKAPKPVKFAADTDFNFGHNVGGGSRPKKGKRPAAGGTGGS